MGSPQRHPRKREDSCGPGLVAATIASYLDVLRTSVAATRGTFAVLHEDGRVVVHPTGRASCTFTVDVAELEPGCHIAVSPRGAHVVITRRSGMIECWDVARQRRLWLGRPSRAFASPTTTEPLTLGAPMFLDDTTFATHHDGGIVLWYVASHEPLAAVTSVGNVRASYPFGPDRLLAVPELAGAAPFVVDTKRATILGRWPAVRDGVVGVAVAQGVVVVAEPHRVRVQRGDQHVWLSSDGRITAVAVDHRGVAWATHDAIEIQSLSGYNARRVDTSALACIALSLDGDHVRALGEDGRVHALHLDDGVACPVRLDRLGARKASEDAGARPESP